MDLLFESVELLLKEKAGNLKTAGPNRLMGMDLSKDASPSIHEKSMSLVLPNAMT